LDTVNNEKMVCHHCYKLIEMFKTRYRTITFPSSDIRASLEGLKYTKRSIWQQHDVEYVFALYITGERRQ